MRFIAPITITEAMILSTNLAEDDHPEWDGATTYAEDAYCIITGSTHAIYRSLQAGNLNNSPLDPANINVWWQRISATNRWKPFDDKPTVKATGAGSITFTFGGLGLVDGVALIGLEAESARLVITAGDPVVTVYDQTISLADSGSVVDWYTYFFEPTSYADKLIFPEVPPYSEATYEVTISGTGTVGLGQLVLGRDHRIGTTVHGTGLGIEDFSSKEVDDFGNAFVEEGYFAQIVDFEAKIDTQTASRVFKLLASRRAKPTVYYAGSNTDHFGTSVFGIFEGFSILLSNPAKSDIKIEVQELI